MQFSPTAQGFVLSEIFLHKSKSGLFEFNAKANFEWSNAHLGKVEKKTFETYTIGVGQEVYKKYKSEIKSLWKVADAAFAKAEKAVSGFAQKLSKKPPANMTNDEVKAFIKQKAQEEADKHAAQIGKDLQNRYQQMLPQIVKKAHDVIVKKLGNAVAALKKNHGKALFKGIMFVVAVSAVVLAAVALGPLTGVALAVGITAVAVKGLTVLGKGYTALRDYIKQWNSHAQKSSENIDTACDAIEKAVASMEACHQVRETILLKVAGAQSDLKNVKSGLSGNSKQVPALEKQAGKAEKELQELEGFIGKNTGDILKALKEAQSKLKDAKSKKPRQVSDAIDTLNEFVKNVADAAV
jgi:hypothetical protein